MRVKTYIKGNHSSSLSLSPNKTFIDELIEHRINKVITTIYQTCYWHDLRYPGGESLIRDYWFNKVDLEKFK